MSWKREPLDQEEKEQLIEAAKESSFKDEFIVRTLIHTGMRVAEFTHMKADWINWQDELLRIPPEEGDWSPKTKYGARTIPIVEPDTHRVMRDWFKVHDDVPMHRSTVTRRVKNVAEKTDIRKKVTPHVLRHTYGTTIAARGATARYISQTMGHKDIRASSHYIKFSGAQISKEADDIW